MKGEETNCLKSVLCPAEWREFLFISHLYSVCTVLCTPVSGRGETRGTVWIGEKIQMYVAQFFLVLIVNTMSEPLCEILPMFISTRSSVVRYTLTVHCTLLYSSRQCWPGPALGEVCPNFSRYSSLFTPGQRRQSGRSDQARPLQTANMVQSVTKL